MIEAMKFSSAWMPSAETAMFTYSPTEPLWSARSAPMPWSSLEERDQLGQESEEPVEALLQ
ncbi:MAG: hypothetical protein M3P50_01170 [Actinomycetota bacterium]|nr:hypothetical protein [Actinomycetota bacterium]